MSAITPGHLEARLRVYVVHAGSTLPILPSPQAVGAAILALGLSSVLVPGTRPPQTFERCFEACYNQTLDGAPIKARKAKC